MPGCPSLNRHHSEPINKNQPELKTESLHIKLHISCECTREFFCLSVKSIES